MLSKLFKNKAGKSSEEKTKKAAVVAMQSSMGKKRGKLLSAFIVITFLGQAIYLFAFFSPEFMESLYPKAPDWLSTYIILNIVATYISLYGLWRLKRWAVFLTAAAMLIEYIIEAALINPSSTFIIVYILMFFIITRRWKYFD